MKLFLADKMGINGKQLVFLWAVDFSLNDNRIEKQGGAIYESASQFYDLSKKKKVILDSDNHPKTASPFFVLQFE